MGWKDTITEDTPESGSWRDTIQDTQTPTPEVFPNDIGTVGEFAKRVVMGSPMSDEEYDQIKGRTPMEAVKHGVADAFDTASLALPVTKLKGLAGFAARAGSTAATSGTSKALNNVAEDKPISEGVGRAAGIGGLVNMGVDTGLGAASLIPKFAKIVKESGKKALFGHKLSDEVLNNPVTEKVLADKTSLVESGKNLLGLGQPFKSRVGDALETSKAGYDKAFKAIPDDRIPVDELLPDSVLAKIDVPPEQNQLRGSLESKLKTLKPRLEPREYKAERLSAQKAQRDAINNRTSELRSSIEQKRAAKLDPLKAKFDEDLIAAKNLDLENMANQGAGSEGAINYEADYLKRRAQIESLQPTTNEEILAQSAELRNLDRQFHNRGMDKPTSSLEDITRNEYAAKQSLADAELSQELAPLQQDLTQTSKIRPPELPIETNLQEAYNIAHRPVVGELDLLDKPLGDRVRELGGEPVVAADAARAELGTTEQLQKTAVGADSNNTMGRDAAWALLNPKIWLAKAAVAHPEIRYTIGEHVLNNTKWMSQFHEAFTNGGMMGINALTNTLTQTDPEFRKAQSEHSKLPISPYQEGAEKPRAKRTELKQEDFLKGLGNVESNGDHKALNKDSSATGKYQFLWNDNNQKLLNNWAGFPVSRDMFLRKPKLQDSFMRYVDETQLTPQAMNLQKMEPNAANRSLSELKALIHFKGPEGARRYIAEGADLTKDNNMDIEKYLNKVYGE